MEHSQLKRELEINEAEESSTEVQESSNKNQKVVKVSKRARVDNIEEIITSLDVSDYYIENGLRKVYPYFYTYYSYAKGRWIGRKISELFQAEFRSISDQAMKMRCQNGFLKVNGESVDSDYVLKNNDFITNRLHRHEFPVLAAPIPIVFMDNDILVIDKPPSLPVHPCGKYRLNTITSLLEKENKIKNIHVVHRLDRLTSGVMIMARTKAKAQKLHEEMRNREMRKEYVCRVEGKFPDGIIEVDQPIQTIAHKIGICIVSPNGKTSLTTFERLNYNGKSSTVLCKPMTGRMHQIRVHLQYLGYPIVNDNFYNSLSFGPNKGKGGDFGKSLEQLVKDIDEEHQRSKYILKGDAEKEDVPKTEHNLVALQALEHYTSQESWQETKKGYEYDASKDGTEDGCEECLVRTCDPTPSEQFIYLHALRYKGQEWSYETQLPVWASDTWSSM